MMQISREMSPVNKALEINLNPTIYGTFAEIGAGQEVARYFFQAGRASQTIAKTISAYDMIVSDQIYGKEPSGRYVCEPRLQKMLHYEFDLLTDRLSKIRGEQTTFFSFASTVATTNTKVTTSHGWMGVCFQTHPLGPKNEISLHIRMLDKHRLQQQETLAVLGVNLIHTVFYHLSEPKKFLSYLVENLKLGQVQIDVIHFNGPNLKDFHENEINLNLVRDELSDAILFSPEKRILNIGDTLWNKKILIKRGVLDNFNVQDIELNPLTFNFLNTRSKETYLKVFDLSIFQNTYDQNMNSTSPLDKGNLMNHRIPVGLTNSENVEKTKNTENSENSTNTRKPDLHVNEVSIELLDMQKILPALEELSKKGFYTIVSRFRYSYELKLFLKEKKSQEQFFEMSFKDFLQLFEESCYQNLEGGLLEGLGKLFDSQSLLLITDCKDLTFDDQSSKTAATKLNSAESALSQLKQPMNNLLKFLIEKERVYFI